MAETLETHANTATMNRLKTHIADLKKAQRVAATNGNAKLAGDIGTRIDAAQRITKQVAAYRGGVGLNKKGGTAGILSKRERPFAQQEFDTLKQAKQMIGGNRQIKPEKTGLEAKKRKAQMNRLTGGLTAKRTPGNASRTRAINKKTNQQLAANKKRAATNAKKTPEQKALSTAKRQATRKQNQFIGPVSPFQGPANPFANQAPAAAPAATPKMRTTKPGSKNFIGPVNPANQTPKKPKEKKNQ